MTACTCQCCVLYGPTVHVGIRDDVEEFRRHLRERAAAPGWDFARWQKEAREALDDPPEMPSPMLPGACEVPR